MSHLSGSHAALYRQGSVDEAAHVHGDPRKRLPEAGVTTHISLWRRFGTRAALVAGMAGITITMSSAVFFFIEDELSRIIGVTAGLFCLLLAIWYAAHPFVKNERHYPELRREVYKFVDLAKKLHYAAIGRDEAAFESIEEEVHAQVEIVIDTARKSRAVNDKTTE